MGKALKPLLVVGLVATSIITGGATAIASTLAISAGAVKAALIAVALTTVASALGRGGGSNLQPFDPKSVNVDPATPRKFLLGQGLFWSDVRYSEPYGPNQEMVDYIFVLAAHRSKAVDALWLGDKLAWTPGGGVTADFAGYLWVEIILEAGVGAFHTAGTSGRWGAGQRLTGCTTAKVTVKRSNNSKTSQSPFASALSGVAVAWVGRGMPVYDPARDSTQPGGSGPQRADDCTTWAWDVAGVERGRNLALQQLAFRLGWRINGELSIGQGIAPRLLNLTEYAVAAAQCDEAVALVAGGSARRFEGGLWATDADEPAAVVQALNVGMNGRQTVRGGKIGLRLAVNDLGTPALTLATEDVIGPYSWDPVLPLEERFTVVRGSYTTPATTPPYATAEVPEVAVPRPAMVPRPLNYDLKVVQVQHQAQRIFKQVAQRNLIGGRFEALFGARALALSEGDVAAFTFLPEGWSGKLFRVESVRPSVRGVQLVLREESALIYQWDREETAPVVPVVGVKFDQRFAQSWLVAGIEAGATENQDAGNMIGTAATLSGATFLNGANLQTIGGQPMAALVGGVNATVLYSDFQPVRGGQRLHFEITAYSDVSTADGLEHGYNWMDAAGTIYAVNLPDMAFSGSEAVGAANAKTKRQSIILPASAVRARFYGVRANWSGVGTFLGRRPFQGHAERGADVTANQPIVSQLSPATGRALPGFAVTDGIPFSRVVARGEARDGQVVTFSPPLPAGVKYRHLYGGAGATAGNNISIRFDGASPSGFTFRAKSQAVVTGSTITDGSASAGGAGEPTRVINRSNGGAPFDGRFVFRIDVDVGELAPGEPGRIRVGLYVRQSGAWVQTGEFSSSETGAYDVAVTPGAVDFGTGAEFGVSVLAASGSGTQLNDFVQVVYTLGTVTETSLTPASASPIQWEAFE